MKSVIQYIRESRRKKFEILVNPSKSVLQTGDGVMIGSYEVGCYVDPSDLSDKAKKEYRYFKEGEQYILFVDREGGDFTVLKMSSYNDDLVSLKSKWFNVKKVAKGLFPTETIESYYGLAKMLNDSVEMEKYFK